MTGGRLSLRRHVRDLRVRVARGAGHGGRRPGHGRDARAPRARRGGLARRRAGRARAPAAVDHRPLRGRQRADDERGRLAVADVQRRDLQLPRDPPEARGPSPLPQPGRRRGDPAPLRGEGRRGGRGARRDVRVRALGLAAAAAAARPRPGGEEAALHPRRAEGVRLCVGGEGAPRAPRRAARARPGGPAALPDLRLRADARHVLPRDPGAAAGALRGGDGGGSGRAEAVLARAVRLQRGRDDAERGPDRRGRRGNRRIGLHDRRRGGGALPRAAASGGRAAARGRRAARRLPLRRARLLVGRGAHGGGGGRAREDVHDRLRGPQRVRRAGARARGGGALLDRAHGVRGGAEGARPGGPSGVAPRRAVRGLVGRADVSPLGADAHEGDGGAQRRRGRRGVRGVPAPVRGSRLRARAACRLSRDERPAGPPARAGGPQAPAALRQALRRGGEPAAARAVPALERVLHGRLVVAAPARTSARASTRSGSSTASARASPPARARRSPGFCSSTSRRTSSTTCS